MKKKNKITKQGVSKLKTSLKKDKKKEYLDFTTLGYKTNEVNFSKGDCIYEFCIAKAPKLKKEKLAIDRGPKKPVK